MYSPNQNNLYHTDKPFTAGRFAPNCDLLQCLVLFVEIVM